MFRSVLTIKSDGGGGGGGGGGGDDDDDDDDDDNNMLKKKAEKIFKYKDSAIEIQRMWNVKTNVIAIITGETGTISKSFRKNLSNIPGKHEIKELQQISILGTAHILWKVTVYGIKRLSGEQRYTYYTTLHYTTTL
jgi:hypothetical protein